MMSRFCVLKSIRSPFVRCILLVLIVALLLPMLWSPVMALSQEQEYLLSLVRVDSKNFPQLSAYFTVLDQEGKYVAGLTPQDFELAEDRLLIDSNPTPNPAPAPDSKVEIESEANEGVWLVLALDTSMEEQTFEQIQESLKSFIGTMREPQDRMAIITFADKVDTSIRQFTNNKEELKKFVDGLALSKKPTKSTYNAATIALKLAEQARGRSAAILLTDSGNVSPAPIDHEMGQQIEESQLPLYVIGFSPHIQQPSYLSDLTKLTIGQSDLLLNQDQVLSSLERWWKELQQGYRLTWKSQLDVDEELHQFVINLKSQSEEQPATANFNIEYVLSDSWSVDVEVSPANELIRGNMVEVKVNLEGRLERDIERVDFLINGKPYKATESNKFYIKTNDYPLDDKGDTLRVAIKVRVEDSEGDVKESAVTTLEVVPAPLSWWMRGLLIGVLVLAVFIVIWLLRKLLAWQKDNLKQKFSLKISNQGNTEVRYKLVAEEDSANKSLNFEFWLDNQLLVPETREETIASTAVHGQQRARDNSARATARRRNEDGNQASQAVERIEEGSQALSQIAPLLGPLGGPLRGLVNTVTQTMMKGRQIRQIPQMIGRRFRFFSRFIPSSDSEPSTSRTNAFRSTSTSTTASRASRSEPTVQYITDSFVVTRPVEPGKTLFVDLLIKHPFFRLLSGANYPFTVTSKSMDQTNSTEEKLQGTVNSANIDWRKHLFSLFLFIIACLIMIIGLAGVFFAVMMYW